MSSSDLTSIVTDTTQPSWAEEVEKQTGFPAPVETVKDGIRTRVEYIKNDNEQKVKITSTFKIETKRVPKIVAERKKWKKFGTSDLDGHGPQSANTMPAEEVTMQFIRNRAGVLDTTGMAESDNPFDKLKQASGMHCRFCKQKDHFSVNCPYKDMLMEADEAMEEPTGGAAQSARDKEAEEKVKAGVYVPPSQRAGAPRTGSTMDRGRDENTVRVTNLPEDTTDQDLRDLFGSVGRVTRIFLAKDKATQRSKGFAFVTYEHREDAEKAIYTISGHKYEYVILKVEWARQNN